jgi:hypothetical protein
VFEQKDHQVEIPMIQGIPPGSWGSFVVNVTPSKPEDLRFLWATFILDSVSLQGSQR